MHGSPLRDSTRIYSRVSLADVALKACGFLRLLLDKHFDRGHTHLFKRLLPRNNAQQLFFVEWKRLGTLSCLVPHTTSSLGGRTHR